eukprot:XP_001704031.1 Hypothetical protein GL50803_24337 [Giardia lamblia ATCC 50803]
MNIIAPCLDTVDEQAARGPDPTVPPVCECKAMAKRPAGPPATAPGVPEQAALPKMLAENPPSLILRGTTTKTYGDSSLCGGSEKKQAVFLKIVISTTSLVASADLQALVAEAVAGLVVAGVRSQSTTTTCGNLPEPRRRPGEMPRRLFNGLSGRNLETRRLSSTHP